MKRICINEIVQKRSSSLKASDVQCDGKYPVFGAPGQIGYLSTFQTESEALAIIKDGAGVGRVLRIPAHSSVIGTLQLLIPYSGFDVDYVRLLLSHLHLGSDNSGATIPHIYFKDYGKKEVVDRPLPEQKTIVGILTSLESAIEERRSVLANFEAVIKSRFIGRESI